MAKRAAGRAAQISLRIQPELVDRLDAVAEAMSKRMRGVNISRTDVALALITQNLPWMEADFLDAPIAPEELKRLIGDAWQTTLLLAESLEVLDPGSLETLLMPGYTIKKTMVRKK